MNAVVICLFSCQGRTMAYENRQANQPICLSVSLCAPGGARFQRVKVSNPPGSGKDIAESKGVRRETESEGS
ncbi:hypothetical protein, partial [Blautia sp.]|uniref:hypothetical protein n=1 Tax=Blautia sp. TaxID=1955243 RepID=UPI003AB7848A